MSTSTRTYDDAWGTSPVAGRAVGFGPLVVVTGLVVTGMVVFGLVVTGFLVTRALLAVDLRRGAVLGAVPLGPVPPPADVPPPGEANALPAVPAFAEWPPLTATKRTNTVSAAVTRSPAPLSRNARLCRPGRT